MLQVHRFYYFVFLVLCYVCVDKCVDLCECKYVCVYVSLSYLLYLLITVLTLPMFFFFIFLLDLSPVDESEQEFLMKRMWKKRK